jgi:hypothetical protein
MPREIINTGNVANDGTGESLRAAFVAINSNFSEIYATGLVNSDVTISGNTISVTRTNNNLVLAGNGIGNIQANSSIQPNIDRVHDIGSPTSRFDTVYAAYLVGNIASGSSISTTGNVSGGNVSSTGSIVAAGVITGLAFNGILDGGNATSF